MLPGVCEWCEGMPVELWLNRGGRFVLRVYNEVGAIRPKSKCPTCWPGYVRIIILPDVSTSLHPLHQLLDQIIRTAEGGLHLVAIGMAVSLPHLCASLGMEDGRAQGKQYKDWCADNLNGPEFAFVTPEDLYSFRCGVLHQGRFGDLQHKVSRIIFVPPNSTFGVVNCRIGDAYFYGVVEFCRNMCAASAKWYEANKDDPVVVANSKRMMGYHPDGFAPYTKGFPVIA